MEDLQRYLKRVFAHELNFEAEDLFTPIDSLTYKTSAGDNCLHLAAMDGDIRAAQYLLDCGFDINEPGDFHYTALHYAYQYKHADMIKFLLKHGANPELRNFFDLTPSRAELAQPAKS